MRRWLYTPYTRPCGSCGVLIPEGQPVLEIRLTDVSGARYRCQECAGEPVPDQIDAREEVEPVMSRVLSFTLLGDIQPDLKLRQTGE